MSKKSKKRKLEGEEQSMVDWEEENIFPDEVKKEMESMWEIPQIFHFLHLAKEALNIPHLSMYEMERMLQIPRASKQLANIMTSLLSSPVTKAKLRKIPPMPYEFWTNILACKMKGWFRVYERKHHDSIKVLETIGVEPEFWNVFPDAPLLNGKDFEELSFKQRVWLLKTVCDTVMHTRKTVQEEIAKQSWEDQFETTLGTDRFGARYIYFPQFIKGDLRVYRHCMENKILSTVKPVKTKLKTESEIKMKVKDSAPKYKIKTRKKRSRLCNSLSSRSKINVNKHEEKLSNDYKCNSDSATGSLMNEDTNLSSTSTFSNNNNHINLDSTIEKTLTNLPKTSEISTTSGDTQSTIVRSSGYDSNSSISKTCSKRSSQRMFKGFSKSKNDNCNIEIISAILNDLKSQVSEEKVTEDGSVTLTNTAQGNVESNPAKQCLDSSDSRVDESTDRSVDNLSSSSKTDDEKLNEIIGAEGSKLNDQNSSNVFYPGKEIRQMSTTSKSDDEKLIETRTIGNCTKEKKVTQSQNEDRTTDVRLENNTGRRRRRSEENKKSKESTDSDMECKDENDLLSLSELRTLLQREAMQDDCSFDGQSEVEQNLRKLKRSKSTEQKQNAEDFNEMLLELGTSDFLLVADSVESLRELISSFSPNPDSSNANSDKDTACETRLVNKLTELLASVDKLEPALRNSVKKARGKLQKEWTSYKEGSVEDQDSSDESGLSSNWWVLGSQGCPLPISGDATLQTLPQPALSSVGSKNSSDKCEDRQEECTRHSEQEKHGDQDQRECEQEITESDTQRRNETEEGQSQASTRTEEDEKESKSKEEEQHTRRVLRARGVSSYTEQYYSDDEIEENELEEWADVEAVYAAPCAQASTSTPDASQKVRHNDDWSNEEDSDKDWILPSSRKRKNKRPSANRRLKSFQHKIQSIKVDALQETTVDPKAANVKDENDLPKVKEVKAPKAASEPSSTTTAQHQEPVVESDPKRTVAPAEIVCKAEPIDSVHSELDIKDEGPIFDSVANPFDSNYNATLNQNYVMLNTNHNPINYYVMQPNPGPTNVIPQNAIMQAGPVVSGIMPPIQHGYYMQGGQNYIIHNPQPSFVSPQQPYQSQGPQMLAPQHFIGHPGYVPYVMPPPQTEYLPPHLPRGQVVTQVTQNSTPANSPTTRPPARYSAPRPSFPHPNGAVIRSSMPIRGSFPRVSNSKLSQQRVPSKVQKPRKPSAASERTGQKTTSLIVLSDSDDEIEMIITEKSRPQAEVGRSRPKSQGNANPVQRPVVAPENPVATPKGAIPPQIIQRMSQGGISITPVRPAPQVQTTNNTQLVVVVNDTGSHYALSLPNGSKLILTPEQVAQIRASNGGKLIL